MGSRGVPEELWRQFCRAMPVASVDAVVVRHDGLVLLLRRLREPVKGKLWFPSGPLGRNEDFEEAVRRVTREQAALQVADIRFLGVDNLILEGDPFGHQRGSHMVAVSFLCRPWGALDVKVDPDHSGHVWSDGTAEELEPHVRRFAVLAKNTP